MNEILNTMNTSIKNIWKDDSGEWGNLPIPQTREEAMQQDIDYLISLLDDRIPDGFEG